MKFKSLLVIGISLVTLGLSSLAQAIPTKTAISRCNQQRGCMVIHESNGDVVIFVDDVDGDGKGGGVIRCPAETGDCNPMRKKPPIKKWVDKGVGVK
jgi:hypothetical protein